MKNNHSRNHTDTPIHLMKNNHSRNHIDNVNYITTIEYKLTKHTYICFGELPNNDWYNDSWYSGNSICDSHQSSLNR
jgi:hypothetical protein